MYGWCPAWPCWRSLRDSGRTGCGWQLQIFICSTTAIIALALLARAGGWWSFAGAVLSCITATFSFAVGTLVWPLGLVVVLMSHRYRQRNVHALVWLVLGVAIMLVYGHALSRVDPPPADITWPSLWALGAPLTSESLGQVGTAAFFGALGLATYALLLSRHARDPAPSRVFWSVVPLLPIGAGLMTGIGRHAIGLQYAASSRYVTISTLFWIALLAGPALASDSTSARDERPGRPERGIPGMAAIIPSPVSWCPMVRSDRLSPGTRGCRSREPRSPKGRNLKSG